MVASGNCLFITVYDRLGMPGLKNSYQKLYYLDELNKWKIGSQRSCSDMVIESLNDQGLIYSAMPWGIAATYVTEIQDGQICYELAIYTWGTKENEKYILDEPVIKKYELSKTIQGRVVSIDYAPHCTFEGLIVCGGHLLRFNGEKWLENDSLLIEGIIDDEDIFWLTAGNDCVVKTENTTNHILGKVQVLIQI